MLVSTMESSMDPITILYFCLAVTAMMAAFAARELKHHRLARVYFINAIIYGAFGTFHLLTF
jgi:hypothetical protein